MTLGEQQRLFAKLVGQLIAWVYSQPEYELTFGEAWRTFEQAALNAKTGIGIENSLHCQRLAVDLNLFVAGTFKVDPQSYRPMGEYWKTLHPLCRWGGDFHRVDADHFSMEWQGVQ